jgi:hypothetical protein
LNASDSLGAPLLLLLPAASCAAILCCAAGRRPAVAQCSVCPTSTTSCCALGCTGTQVLSCASTCQHASHRHSQSKQVAISIWSMRGCLCLRGVLAEVVCLASACMT